MCGRVLLWWSRVVLRFCIVVKCWFWCIVCLVYDGIYVVVSECLVMVFLGDGVCWFGCNICVVFF